MEISQLHPLVHRNASNFESQVFVSRFTSEAFFLKDHIVKGQKIIPGVVYLEMAMEASRQSIDTSTTIGLGQVNWLRPIVVESAEVEVYTELYYQDDALVFRIYTLGIDGQALDHCQGNVLTGSIIDLERKDIGAIKSSLLSEKTGKSCYDSFSDIGIDYGASFQGISHLWYGDSESLSQINLSVTKGCVLPPGILDSVFQTTLGIGLGRSKEGLHLPYHLEEIIVYDSLPLSGDLYGYVRIEDQGGSTKLKKHTLELLSKEGTVLVRCTGLSILALEDRFSRGSQLEFTGLGYVPTWEVLPIAVNNDLRESQRTILVVRGGVSSLQSSLLISHLNRLYSTKVLEVETLEELPLGVTDIYFLQGLYESGSDNTSYAEAMEYSIFTDLQKLLHSDYSTASIRITAFSYKTQNVQASCEVNYYGSGILGLLGSLNKEQPLWDIGVIDVDDKALTYSFISQLESLCFNADSVLTAFRDGLGYVSKMVSMEFTKASPSVFKEGGIYVILGGSGGLGVVSTRYLIAKYSAQVIWIGRREKEISIDTLLDSFSTGPKPIYITADATNKTSLLSAYTQIKSLGYNVNGLIHSAIVLNDMLVKDMTIEDYKSSFLPKSIATDHFIEVFKDESLDFICFY